MIRSMTGFGRKEAQGAGGFFVIEVRSVNNRYIDIQVKSPRELAVLEPRLKKIVQERFFRGRFDVSVSRNGEEKKIQKLALDEFLAEQYIGILRDLKTRFGLSGEVDLALVAGLKDLVTTAEVKEDLEAVWSVLSGGLAQALDELDRMRAEEGEALARDISTRLDSIDDITARIRSRAPITVENARKRMTDNLKKLLNEQPDPLRVLQEIAILAERLDITEELTRLDSHMKQFRALLADTARSEAVGRKLDFLLQEMGREVNTVGAKALDAEISFNVVNIKAELEKIREQVQNIE